jgi:hypothetical protein
MESPLREKIVTLATRFADEIIQAVSALLAERLRLEPSARLGPGLSGRGGGRSSEEIGQAVEQIVTVLQKNPQGLRSEKLRAELGFSRGQMLRPLAHALQSGRVKKSGQRRRTVYALADKRAVSAASSAAPARKKAAAKRARPRPVKIAATPPTKAKPASSAAARAKAAAPVAPPKGVPSGGTST